MLAVAVDLSQEVISVLARVDEAGLHGAADAQVERQLTTRAPARDASASVSSVEPSSTTSASNAGRCLRSASTTPTIVAALVVGRDDSQI